MINDIDFIFHVCNPRGKTLSFVRRSYVNVRVEYEGHISQKNGCYMGISFSQIQLVPI